MKLFALAALSVLVAGCSLSTLAPVSVTLRLQSTPAPSARPGGRAPAYDGMSCYLVRASAAAISNQLNTDITHGRTIGCLDLGGIFNNSVTIAQAKAGNALSVPSGQIVIEFLGVKSLLADCSGKTVAEIWSAGDPEVYSLARYEGAIQGGETLSLPLSYVQNTTPDRVAACQTSTPSSTPVAIFKGASGNGGAPTVDWSTGPGSVLPPKDGLGSSMSSQALSFPVTHLQTGYGFHAELSFAVPFRSGLGNFAMRVQGGGGLTDCGGVGINPSPSGFLIGNFSNYSGSWYAGSTVTSDGRYIGGSGDLSYQSTTLSGTPYFYISARSVAPTDASCSYLKIFSVTVDLNIYRGRGGDVFHLAPHLEMH